MKRRPDAVAGPAVGTIGDLLERQAAVAPDDPYLFFEDSVTSWGEFDESVTRTARALYDLGVRRGDRVAVLMRNCPEYLLAWLGSVRLGAVYVPVIADNTAPEVDHVLNGAKVSVLVTTPALLAALGDVRGRCPGLEHVVVAAAGGTMPVPAGCVDLGAAVDGAQPSVPGPRPDEHDLAQIAYTSGTTNRPKGIMHTHHPYVRIGIEMSRRLQYTDDDRLLVVLPLFHGNAQITSIMPSIAARTSMALMPRFSGSAFWQQVQRYEPTEVNLLTGLQLMLLGREPCDEERDHTLQFVWGTTTESVDERFRERFGVPTITTYSQTECSFGAMGDRHTPYRPEWVGWPIGDDNQIRVVDEADQPVAPGVVGEIVMRSSCVMQGYWDQPEETERALRGGWLHTGDRGYLDADGHLYFKGRIKHVIRRSGENISGEEVEDIVTSHPEVQECAAVAVPDDIRVEEVKVFVVLNARASLTEEAIVDWCEPRLASFKVPRYIEFRPSLPTTPRGTVKRFELAAEAGLTDCWDRLSTGYHVDWRPEWQRGAANDVTAPAPDGPAG